MGPFLLTSLIVCISNNVIIWSLSLEREEMWPLFLTNINGHIEPILEHNHYCDDNVLNLKRHSGNISFVRPLDLLRFSCNQCFKKGQ